jgi:hypothetical protein
VPAQEQTLRQPMAMPVAIGMGEAKAVSQFVDERREEREILRRHQP